MDHGVFHADLHEGNLFVDQGGRLVAVDFGIVGRLGARERRFLAEVLWGLLGRDYTRVAVVHAEAGYLPAGHDLAAFAQALRAVGEPIFGRAAADVSMSRLLAQLFEITDLFDMRLRPELVLLQKTMVTVEGVARRIDPHLDIWAAAEPVVRRWIGRELSPASRLKALGDQALGVLARLSAEPAPPPPPVAIVRGSEGVSFALGSWWPPWPSPARGFCASPSPLIGTGVLPGFLALHLTILLLGPIGGAAFGLEHRTRGAGAGDHDEYVALRIVHELVAVRPIDGLHVMGRSFDEGVRLANIVGFAAGAEVPAIFSELELGVLLGAVFAVCRPHRFPVYLGDRQIAWVDRAGLTSAIRRIGRARRPRSGAGRHSGGLALAGGEHKRPRRPLRQGRLEFS